MELSVLTRVATLAALAGCGDPEWCTTDWSHYTKGPCNCCYAAQLFAARDTPDLTPPDPFLQEYADRWVRAVEAEPILDGRIPQAYRNVPPSQILIFTTNQSAIDAWIHATIHTGDESIDSIISSLSPYEIGKQFGHPDGMDSVWYFEVGVRTAYNENILNERLRANQAWLSDPQQLPRDDGTWTWTDGMASGDAQVDFRFGWGDCLVACDGFHSLRAVVPKKGPATVYDLGGDPLPTGLSLSPNTKPLP